MTKECVEDALKLYGSGGKSSKVLVDTYLIATEKFKNYVIEMVEILPEPSRWKEFENNPKEKRAFERAYMTAVMQWNRLQQYYEYAWSDDTFGIDEHTWRKYVGAYKNLNPAGEDQDPGTVIVRPLGKTKLIDAEVINADYILKLIGKKTYTVGEVQCVDDETLRIIYEQIQEVSDMGDSVKAELLKRFVDEELLQGKVLSSTPFDAAFEQWCDEKAKELVGRLAAKWGLDKELLAKTVEAYDISEPEKIPYMEDLIKSLDYEHASEKAANVLAHNMELRGKLPKEIKEIKRKYK